MGILKTANKAVDTYTSNHLSPAERQFVKKNPHVSALISTAADKALQEAEQRYQGEGHNGRGDAFRHAYWSALMTREVGLQMARQYGYAHEAVPPGDGVQRVIVGSGEMLTQPKREREMDQFNNAAGRTIGETNKDDDDRALADLVDQALKSGQLQLAP